MRCFVLFSIMFLSHGLVKAQRLAFSPGTKGKIVDYVNTFSKLAKEWAKEPGERARTEDLQAVLDDYASLQVIMFEDMVKIRKERDSASLLGILDDPDNDRQELIEALTLWKYDRGDHAYLGFIESLGDILTELQVTVNKVRRNPDDIFTVLTSQNLVEDFIVPESRKLLDRLD